MNKFVSWIRLVEFHRKRTEFYRDWATSIERGELLSNFLKAELEISRAKQTADPARAFALASMLARVREGELNRPSEVIGLTMPHTDMVLLAAADSAGEKELVRVINDLCTALEEQSQAKSILLKALVTPMVLLPGMGAFAYVLSSQSIPIIEKVAPVEVWTPFNQLVRTIANIINHGAIYMIVAAVAFFVLMAYALPNWKSRLRFRLERFDPAIGVWLTPIAPWLLPLSIYRDFQAVMLLSSLAVLLKRGSTLQEALNTVAAKASPYVRYHVNRIVAHIDEYPLEVSIAFSSGILSPRVAARLATIARTTTAYEKVLIEIGTTGGVEIRKQVQRSATKLNIVFLSLAGFMTMLLYLGQLNITNTMKKEMDPATMMQRKMEQNMR